VRGGALDAGCELGARFAPEEPGQLGQPVGRPGAHAVVVARLAELFGQPAVSIEVGRGG